MKTAIQQSNSSTLSRAAIVAASLTLAAMPAVARPWGVDVSYVQGNGINWGSAKGWGVTYAWAKANQGLGNDPDFTANEGNAKANGGPIGGDDCAEPYAYSPATESGHFWGVAGGYIKADGLTVMPMLDMERFSGLVGASSYSDWANQWCNDTVNNASANGVKIQPFIYTSACSACEFNSSVAGWLSDIADYNGENGQTGTPWSTCTSCEAWGAGVWTSWQVDDTSSVSGIPGSVDLDVLNTSVAAIVATSNQTTHNRVSMARSADSKGYWIVATDGGVFSFGDAVFYGSMGGQHLNAPMVGMAARPQGDGYWLVGSDGGLFTFGAAGFHGSMGGTHLNAPMVGICSTASGNGYWMVGADGGIFTFGDAPYHGGMGGQHLNASIVGMASTSANGYWLVGSDGGIYSFSATFYGSMGGTHLNAPIVSMSTHKTGDGYWMNGSDGGIFTFGAAGFYGSLTGQHLNAPMTAIQSTGDGAGYWQLGGDGG